MNTEFAQLLDTARNAMAQRDWVTVEATANTMLQQQPDSVDGLYIAATAHRVQRRTKEAIAALERALQLDPRRYDIAIELANMYSVSRRNADAARILASYSDTIQDSPRYLDLAGTIYTEIGLSEKAWPLFKRAHELQPDIDVIKANLATCAVFIGKISEAQDIYRGLLGRFPEHRKNHYQLSRLGKATDKHHIDQMKQILADSKEPIDRDIPLLFAIAKELEDLGEWEECFGYYQRACDAVCQVAKYDVTQDLDTLDAITELFDANWLSSPTDAQPSASTAPHTPLFVVGLPRTGTTLLERIVSSHSQVSSLGETLFLPMAIRKLSGIEGRERIDREILQAVAARNPREVAQQYLQAVDYRLSDKPIFIEKLPLNFLYAGVIAKAWPEAKIVHMVRHPMDACFSMYKQVFTWAYKYSYSLEDLGRYYVAYDRLRKHWLELLGERFVEVQYEQLVSDQETQTRRILDRLGLPFEDNCLHFEKNTAPSTTASSVQVRDRVHTDSVQKWRRFEKQLEPLRSYLEQHGVTLDG